MSEPAIWPSLILDIVFGLVFFQTQFFSPRLSGSRHTDVIVGRPEGPRAAAAELGPALFAVFPVNSQAETAGFWATIQPELTKYNTHAHTINEVKKSSARDELSGREEQKDSAKRREGWTAVEENLPQLTHFLSRL